jgi:flagellar protein FliL
MRLHRFGQLAEYRHQLPPAVPPFPSRQNAQIPPDFVVFDHQPVVAYGLNPDSVNKLGSSMAKDTASDSKAKQEPQAPAAAAPAKGGFSLKTILIAAGVFLVQILVLYFLVVKFVAPSKGGGHEAAAEKSESSGTKGGEGKHEGKNAEGEGEGEEALVFVVKDLIVNPAGTNGTRFLLTTIGIEVGSPESMKELEKKEVMVRDAFTNILTAKSLPELTDAAHRESIRTEISDKVGGMLKSGKPKNIYFSKFIIQ